MSIFPITAKSYSLAQRLTLRLAVLISAVWVTTTIGVAWYLNQEVSEAFDAALSESAQRLLTLAAHELHEMSDKQGASVTAVGSTDEVHVENDYLMYQVVHQNGALLMRSADAPDQPWAVPLSKGFQDTLTLRIFTLKHPLEPYLIHMADPMSHRSEVQREVLLYFFLPLLGVLPLLMGCVVLTLRRSLRPLALLAQEMGGKDSHNLSAIDPLCLGEHQGLPKEISVIARSTNALLERLWQAMQVERALAAHAAHELRTPLAAAQLQLGSALNSELPADSQASLRQAMQSLQNLSMRTEKLLQMSRAQSSVTGDGLTVSLSGVASQVVQDFWGQFGLSQRIILELPDNPSGVNSVAGEESLVNGDVDMIAIALRNLIENALRYAPNSPVWVRVSGQSVCVGDQGAGVSAVRLHQLQETQAQTPGSPVGFGLGLSIVKTIMDKHGGVLQLESAAANPLDLALNTAASGGGFSATLRFNLNEPLK